MSTMRFRVIITGFLLAGAFVASCFAQSPASAIVESVDALAAGVQEFDYVAPGRIIELGQDGTLTLGYLFSCERERIEGGTVTVGKNHSIVLGGSVKRLKIVCDGGSLQLEPEQSQVLLTTNFRDFDAKKDKNLPKPQSRLYGLSPVVSVGTPGAALVIRRIDRTEQPVNLVLNAATVDLGTVGIELTPGGLYQAKVLGRGITFEIDASASNSGPILARLLRF